MVERREGRNRIALSETLENVAREKSVFIAGEICVACQKDVNGKKRGKDTQAPYYCPLCWSMKTVEVQAEDPRSTPHIASTAFPTAAVFAPTRRSPGLLD